MNFTEISKYGVSKYGVFPGPYFPVFGLNTEMNTAFSPNADLNGLLNGITSISS